MKRLKLLIMASALLMAVSVAAQTNEIPRSTPEAEGVSSKQIGIFLDTIVKYPTYNIHSVMILRHGKVIAETYPKPYAASYKHTMFSCSKTFVSAAVGLAVAEHRLRVTDRVALFFPEALPDSLSANLADMTVRDLLMMASGIEPDWNLRGQCDDWIPTLLKKPVLKPGEKFKYDSLCTYLLSAIVQKVVGMKVLDYLKLKLFNTMHITDVEWEISPEGYNTGGWGLYIQPESMAKFGQLLLHYGSWNGEQLIPADWVKQMMMKQIENDSEGYGYQMWVCEDHQSARADGAFGQFIIVMPEKDMVVVITECSNNPPLHKVFSLLVPAINGGVAASDARKECVRLLRKTKSYAYPCVMGRAESSRQAALLNKEILLDENELGWTSISVRKDLKTWILKIKKTSGSYDILLGHKQWETTTTTMTPPYTVNAKEKFTGITGPFNVAGCYGWINTNTLAFNLQFVDWYSAVEASVTPSDKGVTITVKRNYSHEPLTLYGTIK